MTTATSDGFALGPFVTTSDGVQIATYELGGHGPPLLLAHATGFHGRVWLPVVPGLRQRYRCVAFDGRGHGTSGKAPADDYDWHGFGRDAIAVINGLGLTRPRAVGHSSGGALLLLAEEAEPGTFHAVYGYEPVLPMIDPLAGAVPENPLAATTRRRREVFPTLAAAYANYQTKPPFDSFDPSALRAYVDWGFENQADGTVRLRCRAEDEARIYEMASHHGGFEHLDRVRCPVTLACGGDRAHFGSEAIGAMAGRLSRSRVEVFDELGHFGPQESPTAVAASILEAFTVMEEMAPAP